MYRSKRVFDEVLIFDILINSKFFLIITTYSVLRARVLKMTAYKQATIIRASTLHRTCMQLLNVDEEERTVVGAVLPYFYATL
jgi:hypothetical protein